MATKRKSDVYSSSSKSCKRDDEASASASMLSPTMSSAAEPVGFRRADPFTIDSRHTVESCTPVQVSAGSTILQLRKRREKVYREQLFYLDAEFARWAAETLPVLYESIVQQAEEDRRILETGGSVPPRRPAFYLEAMDKYLVAARRLKKCYKRQPGDVMTFGNGDCGQLAISELVLESVRPRKVKSLANIGVVSLSCGGIHNLALGEGGSVYAWGANDDGCIGDYSLTTAEFPVVVYDFKTSEHEVATGLDAPPAGQIELMTGVAAGDCHSLVLSESGRVYFFGAYKDSEGTQFRDMTPPDDKREHPKKEREILDAPRDKQEWPVHCYLMPKKAVEVACGFCFNVAILEDRTLVSWGIGLSGELARPVGNLKKNQLLVNKETGKMEIRSDYDHDIIARDYLSPKPVVFGIEDPNVLNGYRRVVENVACGGYHLLVVAREFAVNREDEVGELVVYASGLNNYGQLGLGDTVDRKVLTRVVHLDGLSIAYVAAAGQHSLCLSADGQRLYSFGRGDYGQLGITSTLPDYGTLSMVPTPVMLVENAKRNPPIAQIACGSLHNLVLTEDGDLYTWGYGEAGALGHGIDKDEYRPRKVETLKKLNKNDKGLQVQLVAGGGQHSAIIVSSV